MPTETEEAVRQVPEAVVEVISKKYEAKDLEISPPIYPANGVKDVVVFNPYTNEVLHFRNGEKRAKRPRPSRLSLNAVAAARFKPEFETMADFSV